MSRTKALIDLSILAAVLGSVWSLRFLGLQFVGVLTMAAGIVVVLVLLRRRGQSLAEIGWRRVFKGRRLGLRTLEVMGLTGLSMLVAGLVAGAIFGAPEQSSALSQLPDNFWFFLLDVTVLTWVFIAFGEELVFRGMMINRFETLFGLQGHANVAAVSIAQGTLFGAGHASQGATGMVMTGLVGVALGAYFMTRGERTLTPLVLSHGIIDSTVLTANWLSRHIS